MLGADARAPKGKKQFAGMEEVHVGEGRLLLGSIGLSGTHEEWRVLYPGGCFSEGWGFGLADFHRSGEVWRFIGACRFLLVPGGTM